MDPFNNPKFKKLQAKWYAKLEKAGFEDIEHDEYNLKDFALNVSKGNPNRIHPDVTQARFNHYQACRAFLTNHKFTGWYGQYKQDRKVFELYTEGTSIRKIEKETGIDRRKIRKILVRLLEEMKKEK